MSKRKKKKKIKKNKNKPTTNDPQNSTLKRRDLAMWTPLKSVSDLMCPERLVIPVMLMETVLLLKKNQNKLTWYLHAHLSLNKFDDYIDRIYQAELEVNDADYK